MKSVAGVKTFQEEDNVSLQKINGMRVRLYSVEKEPRLMLFSLVNNAVMSCVIHVSQKKQIY